MRVIFSVIPGGFFSYESSSEGNSAFFLTATAEYENMNDVVAFGGELVCGPNRALHNIRCIKD